MKYFSIGCVALAGILLAFQFVHPLLSSNYTIYISAPLALESSQVIVNSYTLALQKYSDTVSKNITLVVLEGGDQTGAWLPDKEEKNALRAINDSSTIAYFGPINSGAAKVSLPLLNKAGIVQISPSVTWPGLTKTGFTPGEPGIFYPTGKRHFVRVCTTDDVQGPAAARWAKKLGFETVYIVDDGETYGVGIAQLFEAEAKKLGISVYGVETITNFEQNIQDTAEKILSVQPAFVYFGGITPNGGPELLKKIRESDSAISFMGPDGIFENDFILRAGKDISNTYVTAVGAPPEEFKSEQALNYVSEYTAAFGNKPDVFGALAYESMTAFLDTIERTQSFKRAAVLDSVTTIKEYPGMFGTWSFTDEGDTTQILISGHTVTDNSTFSFLEILK